MFLKVNKEEVKNEGTGDYITKSGIYDVVLKHVEIKETTNGATQANYIFDKLISYSNSVLGIDKQPTFGYKILEALAVIAGEEELSNPELTEVQFKNKTEELMCIPELEDIPVKIWVQFSYKMFNNKVQKKTVIKRFYRLEDGASGSEIINGTGFGERLAKDQEYASEVKYSDGATPEVVAAWNKSNMGGDSKETTTGAADTAGFPAKKATGFPRKA